MCYNNNTRVENRESLIVVCHRPQSLFEVSIRNGKQAHQSSSNEQEVNWNEEHVDELLIVIPSGHPPGSRDTPLFFIAVVVGYVPDPQKTDYR